MRYIAFIIAFFLTFSSSLMSKETQYGKALTLTQTTKISELLANPTPYVGKKVLVQGMIVAVCESRGCWMNIASDKPFEQIQIKVVDGEIVFPMSASGKMAKVEGIFESLSDTIEEEPKNPKHSPEERKEAAKEHSKGEYRIRGLGAIITE